MARNLYEILGVYRTATDEEIKNAFQSLNSEYQKKFDDGDLSMREKLFEARSAFDILSNKGNRAAYNISIATSSEDDELLETENTNTLTEKSEPNKISHHSSAEKITITQEAASGSNNNFAKSLGLLGSTLLTISVFFPIISIPIAGKLNYFRNGEGDGVLILLLAATSIYFVFRGTANRLIYTGGAALGILCFTLLHFLYRFRELKADTAKAVEGNIFGGVAQAMIQSIDFEWGWIFLFFSAIIVITSGLAAKHDLTSSSEILNTMQQKFGYQTSENTEPSDRSNSTILAKNKYAPTDPIQQIERLNDLKQSGAITELEFDKLKKAVIEKSNIS